MYLLFAYNDNDPIGDDIPQHQYRQSMIINLFGNIVEPPPPADLSTIDFLNENVCIQSITGCGPLYYYYAALRLFWCTLLDFS